MLTLTFDDCYVSQKKEVEKLLKEQRCVLEIK